MAVHLLSGLAWLLDLDMREVNRLSVHTQYFLHDLYKQLLTCVFQQIFRYTNGLVFNKIEN